jgi:hypothetical protein
MKGFVVLVLVDALGRDLNDRIDHFRALLPYRQFEIIDHGRFIITQAS